MTEKLYCEKSKLERIIRYNQNKKDWISRLLSKILKKIPCYEERDQLNKSEIENENRL
jgi:phosphoenolpyruvate carboxylase